MATINGYTKERLDEIVNGAIKSLDIVGGHLIVTREDDSTFDAGQVQGEEGDQGIQGPPGPGAVYLDDLLDVASAGATANKVLLFNGAAWVPGDAVLSIASLSKAAVPVPSAEGRPAGGTWGDLGTVGPDLTLVTGTLVWIEIGAEISNAPLPGAGYIYMGVEVSGASAIAPNVGGSGNLYGGPKDYATTDSYGFRQVVIAGNNTFRCKYLDGGASGATWGHRQLRVTRLN